MRLYRTVFAFVQGENIFLKMLYKVVQSQKEKNKMLYKLVAHRFFVGSSFERDSIIHPLS